MDPVRHVSDDERRARLGLRQGLAEAVSTVEDAARSVVALHATEPASVALSALARSPLLTRSDVDEAFAGRRLVKQLSMRRTLFAMPVDLLPAVRASICTRIAPRARAELRKGVALAGVATDPEAWIDRAVAQIVSVLNEASPLSAQELRQRAPEAVGSYRQGEGTKWASTVQLTPKVILLAAMEGLIIRCGEEADWRNPRPLWTTFARWVGEVPTLTEREGYAELMRRWLATHGPGTVDDAAWWIGATKAAVRTALADVEAVPVSLDSGSIGWLLPDDVDPVPPPESWVTLLPLLDPAIMGWRDRDFLLGTHRGRLFDSVGNAGTTALVDGRVVGVWVQDASGEVRVSELERLDGRTRARLDERAAALTGWLDGDRVFSVYPSSAMQEARGELGGA